MSASSIADLQRQLEIFSRGFEILHSRAPTRSDIEADPSWHLHFDQLRKEERVAAEAASPADGGPRPGGCAAFIQRRRRFCSHAASGGSTMCSEHLLLADLKRRAETSSAAAAAGQATAGHNLAQAEAGPDLSVLPPLEGGGKKKNLGRRMKRCSNPLAAQHLAPFVPPSDWGKVAYGVGELSHHVLRCDLPPHSYLPWIFVLVRRYSPTQCFHFCSILDAQKEDGSRAWPQGMRLCHRLLRAHCPVGRSQCQY